MNRRGFFLSLTGTLAAGTAVAVAPPAVSGVAVARRYAPAYSKLDERTIQEITERAMRMLGVLGPGERLSRDQTEICRTALRWIANDWRTSVHGPFEPNLLSYELAYEMAPEFLSPRDGWHQRFWGRPKRFCV